MVNILRIRSRRRLVVMGALVLTVRSAMLMPAAKADVPAKPNFVFILSDDQRWDTIGRCTPTYDSGDFAAGSNSCMPFLQQDLIPNGVTFTRAYVTTSVCCPSRASILRGQYSRHTGVRDNDDFWNFDATSTLATWLHDAGYRTGLYGKYLNAYGDPGLTPPVPSTYVPPGWDYFHAFWDKPDYYNFSLIERDPGQSPVVNSWSSSSTTKPPCVADNLYLTDLLCYKALGFLRANTTDPFFLFLTPRSPHPPAQAAGRWAGKLQNVTLPTYPNFNQVPSPNPPSNLPTSPLTTTAQTRLKASFKNQLTTNHALDDDIDVLYHELASEGRLANTVWIYMSDNGDAWGEHRLEQKDCEFEECHKVPMVIVCPPAICPDATPGIIDRQHQVLNIDMAPTIAELAGATPRNVIDGVSLVPLLEGIPSTSRTWFTIDDPNSLTDSSLSKMRNGIVDDYSDGHTYKLVEYPTEHQLYDLTSDPWELANLADDGTHAGVQAFLSSQLHDAITSPVLTLAGPQGPTTQAVATFNWTVDKSTSFSCSLDGGPPSPCSSGTSGSFTSTPLADGPHSFLVHAIDAYNNVADASASFTVDTNPPPTPVLSGVPPDPNTSTPSFSFTDADTTASFLCSLDGAAGSACTSPKTYPGITGGHHTFSVVAVDPAGNVSGPVSYGWNQSTDSTPPVVTMTAPSTDTLLNHTSVVATWSASDAGGIARYDVRERVGTAGVQSIVQSSLATSFRRTGALGTTYCYQVNAVDPSGNVGSGPERCAAVPFDDSSPQVRYGGAVSTASASTTFNGTLTVLNGSGQDASITFSGRKIGFILRKSASSGKAQIWLDGVFKKLVDLYAASTQDKLYQYTLTVTPGLHTARVAWDGTKNASSSGTAVSVDAIGIIASDSSPPDTSITSGPSSSPSTDATFMFVASDSDATFQCSLDGSTFESCSSPKQYSGVSQGSHTFQARAVDTSGNVDPTPSSWTWTVG